MKTHRRRRSDSAPASPKVAADAIDLLSGGPGPKANVLRTFPGFKEAAAHKMLNQTGAVCKRIPGIFTGRMVGRVDRRKNHMHLIHPSSSYQTGCAAERA